MEKEENFKKILRQIIACISHGDYFSAKELSMLELKKLEKENEHN